MHWTRDYVGLPYRVGGRDRSGIDCYGIAWLVYRERLGIEIPCLASETADAPERAQISALIAQSRHAAPWTEVRSADAREFDLVVFRRLGIDSHIGIVVKPGMMLHIASGHDSMVDRYDRAKWSNRLVGAYRHEARR